MAGKDELSDRIALVVIYIYCIGLIYSAILRIVSAFRRTAIVYIQ